VCIHVLSWLIGGSGDYKGASVSPPPPYAAVTPYPTVSASNSSAPYPSGPAPYSTAPVPYPVDPAASNQSAPYATSPYPTAPYPTAPCASMPMMPYPEAQPPVSAAYNAPTYPGSGKIIIHDAIYCDTVYSLIHRKTSNLLL